MIEVAVIVAIVEAAPLGDLGDDVGDRALFRLPVADSIGCVHCCELVLVVRVFEMIHHAIVAVEHACPTSAYELLITTPEPDKNRLLVNHRASALLLRLAALVVLRVLYMRFLRFQVSSHVVHLPEVIVAVWVHL